jgi:saccharopine dehydrogenase-like NADP-dependent oxidoreductase
MHTIALFGAGKIGQAITAMLTMSGRYAVKVCDIDLERAQTVCEGLPLATAHKIELNDSESCKAVLTGCEAVLSALPYLFNTQVAALAVECGIHYFDLTEDVQNTAVVKELASKSAGILMPQCGLAPGFISIAAHSLAKLFDSVETIKMRVGALPLYPSNRLKYALTWSTDGLINEYGNLCEAIIDAQRTLLLPLEGYERFSLDGDEYEAFNTSGGLGSLCESMLGKVHQLDYKSVRYPGHHELMIFLMRDLRFNSDRETLKRVLERSISTTIQDKCLILVQVDGIINKRFVQKTYASSVYNGKIGERHFGAIQITTASGICTPLDLVLSGKFAGVKGLLRCEDINLEDFLNHPFGQYYKDEKALRGVF